eukprot:scaffold17464_cov80-Skeletonema_dohrnii-CCMP3373.AAC.4
MQSGPFFADVDSGRHNMLALWGCPAAQLKLDWTSPGLSQGCTLDKIRWAAKMDLQMHPRLLHRRSS